MAEGTGNGSSVSHEQLEEVEMGCPVDPKHKPGECRVIEQRLMGLESQMGALRREVRSDLKGMSKNVEGIHTLLGFVIDELRVQGAAQGRKVKVPKR